MKVRKRARQEKEREGGERMVAEGEKEKKIWCV